MGVSSVVAPAVVVPGVLCTSVAVVDWLEHPTSEIQETINSADMRFT